MVKELSFRFPKPDGGGGGQQVNLASGSIAIREAISRPLRARIVTTAAGLLCRAYAVQEIPRVRGDGQQMSIEEADIRKVARLAQLHVNDDEVAHLAKELNEIVGFVEQLNEVDVSGVEPVAGYRHHRCHARRYPRRYAAREVVLENGPKHHNEAFLVPKAVKRT